MLFHVVSGAPALVLLLLASCSYGAYLRDHNATNASAASPMPTVDLGYSLYKPTAVNVSSSISDRPALCRTIEVSRLKLSTGHRPIL